MSMTQQNTRTKTVTTVTRQQPGTIIRKEDRGTPYVNENVKLAKRKGITIFRYVQIRRYAFVPADFLIQLKTWFEKEHFIIKKNTRGYGYLAGRRDGIHLNFVPKFLIHVRQEEDHVEVTLTYAARIRKIGITAGILTQGITAVWGAATLTSHVAHARGFIENVTEQMDRIAGVLLGVTWCEAIEGGKEVTTTTTEEHLPELPRAAPVARPPSPPPAPKVVAPPPPPAPPAQAAAPTVVVASHGSAPQQQQQPQIIVVQTPAPMMYPNPYMMGYPPHMMGGYPPHMMGGYPPHMMGGFPPQQQQQQLPPAPMPQLPAPSQPTMMQRPAMLSNTRYPVFEPSSAAPASSASPLHSAPSFTHQQPLYNMAPAYNSLPMSFAAPPTQTNGADVFSDFNTTKEFAAPSSSSTPSVGFPAN